MAGFMFGIPLGDLPEEQRKAIEEAQSRQQMELQEYHHSILSLFEELGVDYLVALKRLLSSISSAGKQAAGLANYWEGMATGILTVKFNVCPTCGVDHHDEFLHSLDEKDEVDGETRPEGD